MAETWIKIMAEELHRLHKTQDGFDKFWNVMKGKGIDTENKMNFYEALAWQGLDKTNSYKNLSKEKKEQLEKHFSAGHNLSSKEWKCK